MAVYEFKCPDCGRIVELRREIGDFSAFCPDCGKLMEHTPVYLYARTDWLGVLNG